MAVDLMDAHREWANRPDDERFFSLGDALQSSLQHYEHRIEAPATVAKLRIEPADNHDLVLVGESGIPAEFTNYSFGQLCRMIGAPGQYLAGLPAELAAAALNHGLRTQVDREAQLLLQNGGSSLKLRALTSEKYARIWNWEVFQWLADLPQGWMVPPARPAKDEATRQRPATAEDVRRWNKANVGKWINVGDPVSPAGIYASDRDMFAFLVHEDRIIDASSGGGKEPMGRGFFVKNSEVGDSTLWFKAFWYSFVCGNHIVWSASNVQEIRIRHIGEAPKKYAEVRSQIIAAANESTVKDMARIQAARNLILAPAQDKLIEWFDMRGIMSAKKAEAAFVLAEKHADTHGNPFSAWGMAAGITRLSQQTGYANERLELDKAAAKVLDVAFEKVD